MASSHLPDSTMKITVWWLLLSHTIPGSQWIKEAGHCCKWPKNFIKNVTKLCQECGCRLLTLVKILWNCIDETIPKISRFGAISFVVNNCPSTLHNRSISYYFKHCSFIEFCRKDTGSLNLTSLIWSGRECMIDEIYIGNLTTMAFPFHINLSSSFELLENKVFCCFFKKIKSVSQIQLSLLVGWF